MRARYLVLGLLVLLSIITYLDRVCVSVAGPRIRTELDIGPEQWGWVLGAFVLAYGLFEIPSGALGDRTGQHKTLTRIVLWWSAFTALTGAVSSLAGLLVVRFLFGAGEAGAYPNMAGSIGRWFPATERARANGAVWAASRVGGALAPVSVVPLMVVIGWRGTFFLFGAVGLVWAAVWAVWYRDRPARYPDVTPGESAKTGAASRPGDPAAVPWGRLIRSRRLWLIMAMYWCYVWGSVFYLTWFPEYLMKGRGLTEQEVAAPAALPFVLGAAGNLAGGFLSDRLTRRYGPGVGRRLVGSVCLALSATLLLATASTTGTVSGVVLLALGFGIMDCMLPAAWAVCLDVGEPYAGAVTGAMNTAGQAGGLACTVLFGCLVERYGDYNVPLVLIATMVLASAVLFGMIDPTGRLLPAGGEPVAVEEAACAYRIKLGQRTRNPLSGL